MEEKTKSKALRIVLIVAAVLLAGAGGAYYYVNSVLSKIERIDKDSEVQVASEFVKFLDATDDEIEDSDKYTEPENFDVSALGGDIEKVSNEPDLNNRSIRLVTDSNVTNILLIGSDSRTSSMRGRSDTMIILSLNRNTNCINMVSILRDTYVEIPGYDNNKLNAAYAYGGTSLLDKTIEHNIGVHIDYNVCINFEGFLNAFAQIGDLQITLNSAEADYLNNTESWGLWNLSEGVNTLTPEQTLAYARMRYVGNADWERTSRQRRVLVSAFNKCRSQGLSAMISMAGNIAPYVATDMSNSQMISLMTEVMNSGMSVNAMQSVPVSGMFQSMYIKGMSALVPDLDAVSRAVHRALYGVD